MFGVRQLIPAHRCLTRSLTVAALLFSSLLGDISGKHSPSRQRISGGQIFCRCTANERERYIYLLYLSKNRNCERASERTREKKQFFPLSVLYSSGSFCANDYKFCFVSFARFPFQKYRAKCKSITRVLEPSGESAGSCESASFLFRS